jgi:hypothetical protein
MADAEAALATGSVERGKVIPGESHRRMEQAGNAQLPPLLKNLLKSDFS